ncbi:MAG: hypothetical protein K0R55_1639 [Sporomusa sp.]|nr:hypothetical protein [Sporomusa sp.]
MSALFWYSCLAVIGLGIAAFAIYKKRYVTDLSTWLVFYLFATGITWFGEVIVLVVFNGYAYKLGIFQNPLFENLVGHLLLNSTVWPGAAVLVVAYRLRYGWISLITAVFILLEYLFINYGLYEQHWWHYYMTVTAAILFFVILKKWFPLMNEIRRGLPRFITLYFAAFVIIHLPIPLMLLYGKQYYSVVVTQDMYQSSTIFIVFYQLVETSIVMFFLFLDKWYWKLAPYFISSAGHIFLASRNILIIQDSWNLVYTLLLYTIVLTLCLLMEKYTLRPIDLFLKQR